MTRAWRQGAAMTPVRTTRQPDSRAARWLPLLCLAGGLLLAGCGGGGGGRPTPASEPTSDPPSMPAPPPPSMPAPNPVPDPEPEPQPEPAPEPGPGLVLVTPPEVEPVPETPPPAQDPPFTAREFADHQEYCSRDPATGRCRNWGLGVVRAAEAYARLANKERALVAPGDGVTVGVIDTGIDQGHWEFDRSRITETILSGASDEDGTSSSHGTAVASLVAARRWREGLSPPPTEGLRQRDFHGIAWGAALKVFAIPLGSGSPGEEYDPISIPELTNFDTTLARQLGAALASEHGVDILNMSFSVSGLIENYDAAMLNVALDDVITTAAQSGREDADKTLLVWAASNDHGDPCGAGTDNCIDGKIDASSPAVSSALPVHVEALRSHSVSVVATQRNGSLASFSNRCGVAAQWCIAAPGEALVVAYHGPYDDPYDDPDLGPRPARGYGTGNGTSYSAPLVAGGLAVLKQYFRGQLGNTEVLARLYETADVTPDPVASGMQCPAHLDLDGDLSDCELSSTHGRGLMDLDAATRPVGSVAFVSGDDLSGERTAAASSWLRGGGASGNALSAAFRGREVAVFDELHAPFWMGLDGFAHPAARPDLGDRLVRFMRPEAQRRDWAGLGAVSVPGVPGGLIEAPFASTRLRLGINRAGGDGGWWSGGLRSGHASLVPVDDGGLSLALGHGGFQASALAAAPALHHGRVGEAPAPGAGVVLAWRPRSSALGMRLGALREFESALGARAGGAFGRLASGVAFAGTGFDAEMGGWGIEAGAELGVTGSEASGGMVREVSALATSAFSFSAERAFEDGGRLRLSLSQPLRVERGRLRLAVPTGRTKRGEVVRGIVDAPLTPSGRQIDLGADWRRPAGAAGGELRLGATLSFQPGHEAGRAPDLALLAGYRLAF